MLEVCFGDSEKGSMRVTQKEMKLLGEKSREIVSFFWIRCIRHKIWCRWEKSKKSNV